MPEFVLTLSSSLRLSLSFSLSISAAISVSFPVSTSVSVSISISVSETLSLFSYLPPQRWIHNLEHGAIVLLYHPCAADSSSLTRLRIIVSGCLRRHIITPSRRVSLQRPFALVSWGCYYNFARFKSGRLHSKAILKPPSGVFGQGSRLQKA